MNKQANCEYASAIAIGIAYSLCGVANETNYFIDFKRFERQRAKKKKVKNERKQKHKHQHIGSHHASQISYSKSENHSFWIWEGLGNRHWFEVSIPKLETCNGHRPLFGLIECIVNNIW